MPIDFTLEDHVATVTINRPERMNAMDTGHYEALSAAWVRVRDDPEIRVAIVTGAGDKSFSAGADLKSFLEQVMLRVLQASEDVRKGSTAFGEKRAPSFTGR